MVYKQSITDTSVIVNGDKYIGELVIYEHDKVGLAIYRDSVEESKIHKIDMGYLHIFINSLVDCGYMLEGYIAKKVKEYIHEQNIF